MSQVFLHIADGRTLWVPTHKAAPHETGSVVILPQVNPTELVRSFYLFDNSIQVVDDARFATSANAKTPADISRAVGQFRERCARDEPFMMSSRYNPGAQRSSAPAAAAPVAPLQQSAYQMPPPQPYAQASVMMPPPTLQSQPPAGGFAMMNQAFLQPPGALHPMQQQQPGYLNAVNNGYMAQPPPPMHHYHQHHHQQQHQYGAPGGYNSMQQGGGRQPYGHHQHHHHHHQQRFGAPGHHSHQQQQGPPGAQQNRFQDIVFNKPQPIETPIEVPKDVHDLYHQPNGRIYLATLPSARITVWLRSHTMAPANYQRYVHCKGGISLMMKSTASDLMDSKPVELFDRQLCTHFLAHNYCSRKGCLHVHHSESQLRHMIAVKHVLLQDTSKREREQMAEDIVAKDRAAQSRPKEDFETRYNIVMSMPPTVVSGTPAHLIKGEATTNEDETQSVPNVLAVTKGGGRGGVGSGGRGEDSTALAEGSPSSSHHQGNVNGTAAVAPAPPRPGRYTGPIGVASDSDSDSSDTDTSDDDSSDSSSSSSDDDSKSSKSGSSAAGDNEEKDLSEEEKAQAATAKALAKENKKKLRKLVDAMKSERVSLEKLQKKDFHKISKDADDSHHQIRKREKKDRKREKRGRSHSGEDRRRRSTSRRRD